MSSADLLLYPTRHEGLPLMPLEAFGCRCPVVTTRAVPYARQMTNAMVSDIGDVDSLAEQVCQIVDEKNMTKTIVDTAMSFALQNSLINSCVNFENRLVKINDSYIQS